MSYTIASPVQLNDTLDVSGTTSLADKVVLNTDGTIKPYVANNYIQLKRHDDSNANAYDAQIGSINFKFKSIDTVSGTPLWGGVHVKSLHIGEATYNTDGTFSSKPIFWLREVNTSIGGKNLNVELTGGLMNVNPNSGTRVGLIMAAGTPTTNDMVGRITVNSYMYNGPDAVGYTIYDQFYPAPHTGKVHGNYSIFGTYLIGASGFVSTSDTRVKTDITVVDDEWALQKVRDIECKDYHYVDPALKSEHKTIGFIAQEVEQHLPHAVTTITSFIPDELRNIFYAEITNLPDGNVKSQVASYQLVT